MAQVFCQLRCARKQRATAQTRKAVIGVDQMGQHRAVGRERRAARLAASHCQWLRPWRYRAISGRLKGCRAPWCWAG